MFVIVTSPWIMYVFYQTIHRCYNLIISGQYKDSPEQLYENEEQIKKEIKEYLDLLLYGVIEDERN